MRTYTITLVEEFDGCGVSAFHFDQSLLQGEHGKASLAAILEALVDKALEFRLRRLHTLPEPERPEIAATVALAKAAIDEEERPYASNVLWDAPNHPGLIHHLANCCNAHRAEYRMLNDELLQPLYGRLRGRVDEQPMKYLTVLAAVDALLAENERLAPEAK